MWNQRKQTRPQKMLRDFSLGVALVALITPATAHAYIDPGTGSVVVQAIIGAAVAVGFFLKVNWLRVKRFFRKLTGKSADQSGKKK